MSIQTLICCLFVAGSIFPVSDAHDYDDSPEAWETLVDLELAGTTFELYFDNTPAAEIPSDFMTLEEFAKGLPELYSIRLSLRDGWGHKFFVGEFLNESIVFSKGEDGMSKLMDGLEALSERYGDDLDRPEELLGDDIVLIIGEGVHNGPRSARSRQQTTMADLRSIGTAVEEFSIDNNFYPPQFEGLRGLESLQEQVAPSYMRRLPMTDAWGNPFLYWSDQRSYLILSTGADGILDPAWSEPPSGDVGPSSECNDSGECDDPNADIVFGNGSFLQWPATDKRR